jgi:hypothetical protein
MRVCVVVLCCVLPVLCQSTGRSVYSCLLLCIVLAVVVLGKPTETNLYRLVFFSVCTRTNNVNGLFVILGKNISLRNYDQIQSNTMVSLNNVLLAIGAKPVNNNNIAICNRFFRYFSFLLHKHKP